MIERGVRFVNIYHEGWDAHSDVAGNLRKNCAATDQASAALVLDLKQRGLLDDTLVIWGGEFGRTPMVETNPALGRALGRDHHPQAFTMWMAGGGVEAGPHLRRHRRPRLPRRGKPRPRPRPPGHDPAPPRLRPRTAHLPLPRPRLPPHRRPRKSGESPAGLSKTLPQRPFAALRMVLRSPAMVFRSPAIVFRSPANVFRSPANVFRRPANVFRRPANVFRRPANVFRRPANVFRRPANVFRRPANVFRRPANVFRSPAIVFRSSFHSSTSACLRSFRSSTSECLVPKLCFAPSPPSRLPRLRGPLAFPGLSHCGIPVVVAWSGEPPVLPQDALLQMRESR